MSQIAEQKLLDVLQSTNTSELHNLLAEAFSCRIENLGNAVYLRGLIEFSNCCERNCFYCGIRKDNKEIQRYRLPAEEIISIAMEAYQQGFHSLALQSGEIASDREVDFIAAVVNRIKELSISGSYGSMGITLSVGELSYQQYLKLWEAGAHRYLLRIETSDEALFKKIHPPRQIFQRRLECLDALKDIGFQVGTGVMIGLPGQNFEHLVKDLQFFRERDIDMLGMGPYIAHLSAPLSKVNIESYFDPYLTSIKMMALARLMMPDINMVASTALQSLHPDGLKMALRAGANIVMPVLTPEAKRSDYTLYANKQYKSIDKLSKEVNDCGLELNYWKWGDSLHYYRRRGLITPPPPSSVNTGYA